MHQETPPRKGPTRKMPLMGCLFAALLVLGTSMPVSAMIDPEIKPRYELPDCSKLQGMIPHAQMMVTCLEVDIPPVCQEPECHIPSCLEPSCYVPPICEGPATECLTGCEGGATECEVIRAILDNPTGGMKGEAQCNPTFTICAGVVVAEAKACADATFLVKMFINPCIEVGGSAAATTQFFIRGYSVPLSGLSSFEYYGEATAGGTTNKFDTGSCGDDMGWTVCSTATPGTEPYAEACSWHLDSGMPNMSTLGMKVCAQQKLPVSFSTASSMDEGCYKPDESEIGENYDDIRQSLADEFFQSLRPLADMAPPVEEMVREMANGLVAESMHTLMFCQ